MFPLIHIFFQNRPYSESIVHIGRSLLPLSTVVFRTSSNDSTIISYGKALTSYSIRPNCCFSHNYITRSSSHKFLRNNTVFQALDFPLFQRSHYQENFGSSISSSIISRMITHSHLIKNLKNVVLIKVTMWNTLILQKNKYNARNDFDISNILVVDFYAQQKGLLQ